MPHYPLPRPYRGNSEVFDLVLTLIVAISHHTSSTIKARKGLEAYNPFEPVFNPTLRYSVAVSSSQL